jgi:hypothetical protein
MVQVLPALPSTGEILGGLLGQFGPQITEGIAKHRATTKLRELLGPQKAQPEESNQPPGQGTVDQQGSNNPSQQSMIASPQQTALNQVDIYNAAARALGPDAAKVLTNNLLEQQKITQKANLQEQSKRGAEDREEIRKFQEPYKDVSQIRKNRNDLVEAKKILESPKFGQGFLRKVGIALAEGKGEGEIAKLLKTPEEQRLFHLLRPSLKTKEVGGSNPSTREVLISLSALPSLYNDPEANQFIIDNMINDADTALDMGTTISKLRQSNPNISFADFSNQVNSQVGERQEARQKEFSQSSMERTAKSAIQNLPISPGKVWMMLPDGTPGQVDRSNVNQAISDGAIILQ